MPAAAQTGVTSADIQRLQDEVYQASTDVSRLRTSDALQAGRLQDELDDLRDDVIYLKVKLRKESNVSRIEYNEVRDQLQELRARARGDSTRRHGNGFAVGGRNSAAVDAASAAASSARRRSTTIGRAARTTCGVSGIPAGQEIDVRLQTRADVGHRAGRGSIRGDDRRRSVPRRSRADPRRLGDARPRHARSIVRRAPIARAASPSPSIRSPFAAATIRCAAR